MDQFWLSMIHNDWLTINKGTFVKVGQKQSIGTKKKNPREFSMLGNNIRVWNNDS